jgi:ABC-type phosphate transport system permease subunit
MLSMAFTLFCIGTWLRIGTTDNFDITEEGVADKSFDIIDSKINLQNIYINISALNVLLMFVNVMQYFDFSSKLSMFYEIMKSAGFDIFFFTLMQVIIMLAYSFMGHILFGITDHDFKTIPESILTLFLLGVGSKSSMDINTMQTFVRTLFGVSFTIMNQLLLNMLVAIYASHYIQYYEEQETVNSSIISLLIEIFAGNPPTQQERKSAN